MSLAPQFTNFRDSIMSICPPFLRKTWGEQYMYTIAIHLDAAADWVREGVKARMPGVGTPEALPAIGADRVIERGFAETDDAYAARLSAAFDSWSIAGSPISIIRQLLGYVSPQVPKIRYVVNGVDRTTDFFFAQWVTIEANTITLHRTNPNNWDWDTSTAEPSRFWIIIYSMLPFASRKKWGDGHFYGDGTAWGYEGGANVVADLRRIVNKWKCAGSQCLYIIAAKDDADFDPNGAPGAPLPDGTWNIRSNRLSTAMYFPGT